jgi:hypothetical protein
LGDYGLRDNSNDRELKTWDQLDWNRIKVARDEVATLFNKDPEVVAADMIT